VGRSGVACHALERVQIDDDEVDLGRTQTIEILFVHVAPRQDAAVHPRVQRLHPAPHHLGRPGIAFDGLDAYALALKGFGRTARCQNAHTMVGERTGERSETGLVRNGDEGGANRHAGAVAWPLLAVNHQQMARELGCRQSTSATSKSSPDTSAGLSLEASSSSTSSASSPSPSSSTSFASTGSRRLPMGPSST